MVFRQPPAAKLLKTIKSIGTSMFSRNSFAILRRALYNVKSKNTKYSTTVQETGERDPAPVFFDGEVQRLLKTLTRPDVEKLFKKRKDGKRIQDPQYKFMTDEQLKEAYRYAERRGYKRLKMPPVVKKRTEIDVVLSKDPELQLYQGQVTWMFTDISYGISDYDRLIVVRQPDGILRYAKWDERQRLNQIYFPLEGREIDTPRMFQEEYLQEILDRQDYEFVLNRACLQFEPNDPEYHRVTESVYAAINKQSHFDHLRSTRHFGPLVFHLAWTKNIDNLLLENITTERLEDAVLAIKVYNKIHTDAKSAEIEHDGDDIKFIRSFIASESSMPGKLEKALQALIELLNARESVAEGIKKAHGH